MGAKRLILWGVDMMTHHAYYKGSKRGDSEIALYKRFFVECKRIGVEVYLGAEGTAYDKVLPLWKEEQKKLIIEIMKSDEELGLYN